MCNDASNGSSANEKPVTNKVKKTEKKRRIEKKDFYAVPTNHEEHMKAKSLLQDLINNADFPDDNSKEKVVVPTAEPKRKKQSTDSHKLLLHKHLVASATDVAKEFGGDVEKTKSEILSVLKDVNVLKGL